MTKEEQQQETATAHAAFLEYCSLGSGRSLRKLAAKRDETGTKSAQITKQLGIWSAKHNWQERVKEYDRERLREYEQISIETLLKHAKADVEVTPASQIKALQLLLEYSYKSGKLEELQAQLEQTRLALEKAGINLDLNVSN